MARELFNFPYILESIPCLIFAISILLFLFVSVSEVTYISLPLVATLYIFQELPRYCMKSTVDIQYLICYIAISNIRQPFISVSVSFDTKELQYTFRTASYNISQSHTEIWYKAIINTQQLYISVSVSCDTKEHHYTIRTASYNRSHSHTAICYIAISNIQQLFISLSVSSDTKNININFVLPATSCHTATLQYAT